MKKNGSLQYVFPQALKALKINGWMTLAAVATVAISLFLCVAFWLMIINIDTNATEIENNVEIIAYIKDTVSRDDYPALEEAIKDLPGFFELTYISKEDGLAALAPRFGGEEELLESLGGVNPLPDSYSVKATSPDDVSSLADGLSKLEQVDSVRYGQEGVERLFKVTDILRKAGIAVMILLALAAVVLVAMTTRITVYARRKEIMIMKWVGATNWYIRWPFILEGVILGFVGGAVAVGMALVMYHYALGYLASNITFMTTMALSQVWPGISFYTIVAGIIMGVFGSTISVVKFLDV